MPWDLTHYLPVETGLKSRKISKLCMEYLVSLALVTDPFGEFDPLMLQECFKGRFIPFKEHFIVDLNQPMGSYISAHHRRYAKKALENNINVTVCSQPLDFLDDWIGLYSVLIRRHELRGLTCFSRSVFEKQFQIPGLVVFRAEHDGKTVGMVLWMVQWERWDIIIWGHLTRLAMICGLPLQFFGPL